MQKYLDMLRHILAYGTEKGDRTGTGTISVFGYQIRFDLSEGFPLLTTKKMYTRGIFAELMWFLRGDTNIRTLVEQKVNIWNADAYRAYRGSLDFQGETEEEFVEKILTDDDFAARQGDLGPVYGAQWRNFGGVDQIQRVITSLEKSPDSRRHIVTAWNPVDVDTMALPPCHVLFQFYVSDGKLSCQLYQRSADAFLGVPFNIASYAALTMMMAHVLGYEPGEFVHTFGDLHIYKNHTKQVREQLRRKPYPLPKLWLNPEIKDLFDFTIKDIKVKDYQYHERLTAPLNSETVVAQVIGK